MTVASPISPLDTVAIQLRPHGLMIQTDDLNEALRVGLAFPPAPKREPPLGPMGRKDRRRARIYAHNRRIAAKRRAAVVAREDGTS